jgi:small subunit ribosomal protein S20
LTPAAARVTYSPPQEESTIVANIASAEKQNRKMIKHRARNRAAMASLRTAVKKARVAVDDKSNEATNLVKEAVSLIDSAVTKGVLKRRTASRYVSRLATRTVPAA